MKLCRTISIICVAGLFAGISVGCKKEDQERSSQPAEAVQAQAQPLEAVALRPRAAALFEPIPTTVEVNEKQAELGRVLYHDKGLSADGTVSCASCHVIAEGGADGNPTSLGIKNQVGPINSPTVLNARYQVKQFWDGRAATLEEQAFGPVENPLEMGHTWDDVVAYLKDSDAYARAFDELYEDGVTKDNAAHAIAEFERTLITPNAPFDKFLRGDDDALNAQELRGFDAFVSVGCVACHRGIIFSHDSFHKMGSVQDYFADRGDEITEADLGLFNVTGEEKDRHVFKVPTLRNVELTAPYMHDGRTETLEEAVRMMAWYQLGRRLEDNQVNDITAFLKTLTGEIPDVSTEPTLRL